MQADQGVRDDLAGQRANLRDDRVEWHFLRAIKDNPERGVVGKARVFGRIKGKTMDVTYVDETSKAKMRMTLED